MNLSNCRLPSSLRRAGLAALAIAALLGLTAVKRRWRTTWGAPHLTAAKI